MRSIILLVFFWQLLLVGMLFVGRWMIPLFEPSFPYHQLLPPMAPDWVWPWANFDGVHYLRIAEEGYIHDYTQALFPLYPLLTGLLGRLINNYLISGLIISYSSLILALWLLVKLKSNFFEDSKPSFKQNSVLIYLLLFPTSFYFIGVYTESLFLLFTVTSFLAAYQKRWWLAGIAGALASSTRFTGILLLPSLLLIWWFSSASAKQSSSLQSRIKPIAWLLLIPTGLGAYMLYLYLQFGDPLYFINAQSHFSAHRQIDTFILWPQVIWRYLKMLTTIPWNTSVFYTTALEFLIGIGFATLSIITWKRLGAALGFYTLASYLLPTLTGSFSSLPRYVLVLFPAFIVLTQLAEEYRWLKIIYLTSAPILLMGSIIYFTRGWWIA